MNIGIFGITANPPHIGHLNAIRQAAKELDQVWVTPVYNHAFAKNFIDYQKRVDMLSLLLEEFKIKNVFLKELDKQYYNEYHDTVYSYNLLKYLQKEYQNVDFKLIIGEDNYKPDVWNKFYKNKELEKEFGLVIIKDEGFHSTKIRNLINNNQSIEIFVGNSVQSYINNNHLYKEVAKCKM